MSRKQRAKGLACYRRLREFIPSPFTLSLLAPDTAQAMTAYILIGRRREHDGGLVSAPVPEYMGMCVSWQMSQTMKPLRDGERIVNKALKSILLTKTFV